jgi:hypothetical protein
MNYELSKQLKEAGFPQYRGFGEKYYSSDKTLMMDVYLGSEEHLREESKKDSYYIPTLSELIEACGEVVLYINNKQTEATAGGLEVEGLTPQEAVAKLWLKLNKEKSFSLKMVSAPIENTRES